MANLNMIMKSNKVSTARRFAGTSLTDPALQVIFAIDARRGEVARMSFNLASTKVGKMSITSSVTDNLALVLGGVSYTIDQLTKSKVEKAVLVLPTNAAIHMLEVRSKAHADMDEEDMRESLIKPWMKDQGRTDLIDAIQTVAVSYKAFLDAHPKGDIAIIKRSTLTKWELDSATCTLKGVKNGDKLTFSNGFTEEGIFSPENTRLSGENLEVTVSEYKNQTTNETIQRFYVPRIVDTNSEYGANIGYAQELTDKVKEMLPAVKVKLSELEVSEGAEF